MTTEDRRKDPLRPFYEAEAARIRGSRLNDPVSCAACHQPIVRVRDGLAWGHVQRQPAGTAHYARPVRTASDGGFGSPHTLHRRPPEVPVAGSVPSHNRAAD